MELTISDYISILTTSLSKGKNQIKLTQFLREHRYEFVDRHLITEKKLELDILPEHQEHSFMVLVRRPDSEPPYTTGKADFDVFLSYGVKLLGRRCPDVHIYLNGRFWKTFHIPVGQEDHNFRKPKTMHKFPKAMSYQERKEWREENEKVKKGKIKKPSDFYLFWKPEIQIFEK